jgi:type II secretory pathway pseudopilin PulG
MEHAPHQRIKTANISAARYRRDGGYLLLAIMLVMVFMIIAATVAAPKIVQQLKRDREEEMIHRGTEYARAIKKYYKKNGTYPASLDDLDKGQVKYLRKRYKDPLTKDGKWKLLNYADIATLLNTAAPGTPAAAMGTVGGNSANPSSMFSSSGSPIGTGSAFGSQQPQQQQQQQSNFGGGFPSNSSTGSSEGTPSGTGNFSGSGTGFSSGSDTGFSSSNSGQNQQNGSSANSNSNQSNSPFGSNSGNGQQFGGGAIVGVASLSKDPTIRIYNKKKTYNEWQFIYNPMMDQNNVLLRGPYQPTTIGSQNIGTPASQMNGQQQNQNSPFGQPSGSGFGQQNSGFGQQNGVGTSPQPSSSP